MSIFPLEAELEEPELLGKGGVPANKRQLGAMTAGELWDPPRQQVSGSSADGRGPEEDLISIPEITAHLQGRAALLPDGPTGARCKPSVGAACWSHAGRPAHACHPEF